MFKTTKGAPHVLLKLITVDKERVAKAVEAKVHELGMRGIRSLAVARSTDPEGKGWEFLGILTFLDPPRPDTKETIHRAMAYGVDVKMITGDHTVIAKETARQLGMGTNIKGSENLPSMQADGKIPKDLGKKYGKIIMEADGFAQARCADAATATRAAVKRVRARDGLLGRPPHGPSPRSLAEVPWCSLAPNPLPPNTLHPPKP